MKQDTLTTKQESRRGLPGRKDNLLPPPGFKKAVGLEGFLALAILVGFCVAIGHKMGPIHAINTLLNTAYGLLISTVFFILAVAVVMGALSELLAEFGVVSLINRLLSPLIRPVYGLPGASMIGIMTTYLSDNPAILTLADNKNFRKYFKPHEVPVLTNLGTSFGMGLIITAFVIGIPAPPGENLILAVLVANLAVLIASVVSTRLMLYFSKRHFVALYGPDAGADPNGEDSGREDPLAVRHVREGGTMARALGAMLDGGKSGVKLGVNIIPGVLIICTAVIMLTNGPSETGVYTGAAYEGVGFFPWLGDKLGFVIKPLFGFSTPECIAVPITTLGAAGAAISLIPALVKEGFATARDVAVFSAMCMCWSGYLSTHVAMMESIGHRELTGKAIFAHTVAGLVAGVSANVLFRLFS